MVHNLVRFNLNYVRVRLSENDADEIRIDYRKCVHCCWKYENVSKAQVYVMLH
jgi:hypothetical protein